KEEKKPEELKADNKADDDFGDFNAEDIIESDGKLDFGDIEEIQKSDSEQGVIFKGNAVEDADLENMVSDMFLLGGEELKDELIDVEDQEDYAKRMYQQRAVEIGQREGEKGIFIPDTFFKQAVKEKALKGKFSKTFTNNIGDFGSSIEKFGSDLMGNNDLIKAMGVKSSIELLHVGHESLKSYVKKTYNYVGDDINILKNYAALIAAKMQEQLIFFIPKEVDGGLTYEPKYVPTDVKAGKGSELEKQHRDHRRAGIRTEIALRNEVPLELSERAGRAFREKNKLDTFGFAGIESLSDRLSNVKPSTDVRYMSFVNDFNSYFQAVERFAYKPLKQAQYTRLLAYVNEALDSVSSYIHGKKIKEERHRIAKDAENILREQKRILTVVIEKGVLQDADNSVTFTQVFKAGKSLLKISDAPVQKTAVKTEQKTAQQTAQKTEKKTAEKKTTEKKAAPAIKVKINKKMEKEYLKAREKVAPEYKEAKLDEAYQKELRENLKTKKIDWAKDMAEGSELQKNARGVLGDADKEGYIIRQVLVTQMKQILAKYPDTTADEVEATVNEYLRRLVTKSQYRFRVSGEAAKLILNSRYYSSKTKNTEKYNELVKKQYSANTKLTAHQSIAFGSLGGDTAKELGAFGGDKDFLASYGKVSFKLNKDRMKGRVTFMAGNSMGMSKKDYGLIGYTNFYDLKHGRAAYIDDENGEAPDVTCCGDNFMAIYERARQLKKDNWKGMESAEHEAPQTIVDKQFQIYYEAHYHGTVGAAEIEEATMVMSERQDAPNWNFDRGAGWDKTKKAIKNDKEIKEMYDCINIINAHPEVYGRQGMEEMKLTLWDLSGNMVSYDELKQIFEGK
ncbi:MAG: hypothetical protein J5509_04945, partial [Lachnospiraceae bacterium]|nr:hypothetical protein [Lachnospiraceae bacterium]